MTIFFLIYWKKSKRFSLIVNSVKILSEKDKKIQREYYVNDRTKREIKMLLLSRITKNDKFDI